MATHKRTRTGCWTCREAGYKCDELKPFCGRCIRLKITCKGYGVKLKWQDDNITTPIRRPRRTKRKISHEPDTVASPVSVVSFASTPGTSTSPRYSAASPASTYSLPLVPNTSLGFVIDLSSSDRWLLQYWIQRLSTLISVAPNKDHVSPFQLHLTAMVHDSAALRSTVLSMAANHLFKHSDISRTRFTSCRKSSKIRLRRPPSLH
jgi:hypothetical protein